MGVGRGSPRTYELFVADFSVSRAGNSFSFEQRNPSIVVQNVVRDSAPLALALEFKS